ncbi:MAG: hypothetical protein ACOX4K_00685 [Bacillota bacterium]|jgi:hypothetical protein
MPDQGGNVKDYENTIEKIKDVIASRVVMGESGLIEEVHVLAGSGRSPKYIVRDVESAILAAFGVQIDRRKISVAQINEDEADKDKRRLRLMKVALAAGTSVAEVSVQISLGESIVSGTSKGVPTPNRWLWLAAEATLDALGKLLPAQIKITVSDVGVAVSKSVRVALVTLVLVEDGRELILSGSCPIAYDDREAVVKATLDAINRKFPTLLDKGSN